MTGLVDLRSDTVTRPTRPMRHAMASADVGDDVYGEDPTINALEAEVAELFGLGAAMFVPSGTMSNQISLSLLCARGDEVLCDARSHIVSHEAGALAAYGGVQTRTVVTPRGLLTASDVAPQLRGDGYHAVPTSAVSIEQTHNFGGGAVYPLSQLQELRAVLDEHSVSLHCDGARIWNAHIATGVSLRDYGALFDTMSVCFSKGLGAPVGSMLVMRDAGRLEAARVLRHRLGGAMRQAGIIAAAGRYALAHNLDRLADDHRRARRLADGIAAVRDGVVNPDEVETNIVMLDLTATGIDAPALVATCEQSGVLVSAMAPNVARLVTHLDIDDEAVEAGLKVICAALSSG